jgi:hypothetical protein
MHILLLGLCGTWAEYGIRYGCGGSEQEDLELVTETEERVKGGIGEGTCERPGP